METYREIALRDSPKQEVPDRLYDYEFALKNTEKLLGQDPKIRDADRKLIQAFIRHVRAQGVSVGRQAKILNHLRRSAQLIPVSFRKASRRDIEGLLTRLADFEWVERRKDGTAYRRTHYSPETMADHMAVIKRFMKFVKYGNTDKETPWPEEVKWMRMAVRYRINSRLFPYPSLQEREEAIRRGIFS